jgi:hypothetical protein
LKAALRVSVADVAVSAANSESVDVLKVDAFLAEVVRRQRSGLKLQRVCFDAALAVTMAFGIILLIAAIPLAI